MLSKQVVAAVFALSLLTACQSSPQSAEESGTATGAVLGGAGGSQVGHGTAPSGVLLENSVSPYMDRSDQLKTAQALETAKDGQVTTWQNRNTRQRYSVTPTRSYSGPRGWCREFTTLAQLDDGRHKIVHAIACRRSDGTWTSA